MRFPWVSTERVTTQYGLKAVVLCVICPNNVLLWGLSVPPVPDHVEWDHAESRCEWKSCQHRWCCRGIADISPKEESPGSIIKLSSAPNKIKATVKPVTAPYQHSKKPLTAVTILKKLTENCNRCDFSSLQVPQRRTKYFLEIKFCLESGTKTQHYFFLSSSTSQTVT